MKVLVAGANGHTGRLVIKKIAEDGKHKAYAMIRKEEQADALKRLGAEGIVLADLEGDLSVATEGMDAVIFAAGSGSKTGPDKTISVDLEGAKKLVDAAKDSDVKHFVILSAMGANDPQGPIKQYLEAKAGADNYLLQSGLDYTVVRPGGLTHDPGNGLVNLKEHIEDRGDRIIPREDVADVMVASLDIESAKGQTFELLSGKEPIEEALKGLH